MSTVHPRDDSRILHKEIRTLAKETGQKVFFYVQDGAGDAIDTRNDCAIVDTGKPMSRLRRMTVGAARMIAEVRKARPRLVFFHDPELIPWAVLLKLSGIKVIYDVHEDYPGAVARNRRLPRILRPALGVITGLVERVCSVFFDGVVAVSPEIARRFPSRKTVVVRNSPVVDELVAPSPVCMSSRPKHFAYVGTINEDRNIHAMVRCVGQLVDPHVRLRLAGSFTTPGLKESVSTIPGWERVVYDGWLSRDGVRDLLAEVRAGLLLIKPIPYEMNGMPIKMCEYMAASVPIIASDFPFWREIVEGTGAGIVVDPLDDEAIVRAMRWMLENPEQAAEMGRRGRRAVLERFNWEVEAEQLLSITRKVLAQ
jgi:glycosyltransferase involved in cell wall biosynthesis